MRLVSVSGADAIGIEPADDAVVEVPSWHRRPSFVSVEVESGPAADRRSRRTEIPDGSGVVATDWRTLGGCNRLDVVLGMSGSR
jgi:hypothetical protein